MPIEIYLACGGVALAIPLLLYAVGAADKFAEVGIGRRAGRTALRGEQFRDDQCG